MEEYVKGQTQKNLKLMALNIPLKRRRGWDLNPWILWQAGSDTMSKNQLNSKFKLMVRVTRIVLYYIRIRRMIRDRFIKYIS